MNKVKVREEIPNTLVTIYKGFTRAELQARADRHRQSFIEACCKQGHYLPSDKELDRWFSV